jgi:hypothetical protein
MIGVTFFGLVFTPTFYVAARSLSGRIARLRGGSAAAPALVPAE